MLLLSTISAFSKEIKKNEAFYRDQWAIANNGKTEVNMGDRTRCDMMTATHAIEVDNHTVKKQVRDFFKT